jgi:hypothetical protein
MASTLSIMLIPYFVLYLLSSCCSRLHGKSRHSKQNVPSERFNSVQFLMTHRAHDFGLPVLDPLHPGHVLMSRWYAMQRAQFMPQGAIRNVLSDC